MYLYTQFLPVLGMARCDYSQARGIWRTFTAAVHASQGCYMPMVSSSVCKPGVTSLLK